MQDDDGSNSRLLMFGGSQSDAKTWLLTWLVLLPLDENNEAFCIGQEIERATSCNTAKQKFFVNMEVHN